jgi:uncharacterized membrane protein YeaQ/YmgE (transglycosylase-associated protein family)
MAINADEWIKRAEQFERKSIVSATDSATAHLCVTSMAASLYGENSQQLAAINRRVEAIGKEKGTGNIPTMIYQLVVGSMASMAADIKSGLVGSMRLGIAGEVLADLIALAREALDQKNVHVAAVLAAAAYEDLLRRLGREKAGITTRIKLEQVINGLADKGVLVGGEPATVQGFLRFRNDSLHSDRANVTEVQVTTCLGLLDS